MSEAWIDIDLDKIISNYHEVIAQKRPASKVMAVVKADGYGLGAVQIARALAEQGCDAFAVTTVEEGLLLRAEGLQGLILVLGPGSPARFEEAIRADLQLTLSDPDMLRSLQEAAEQAGDSVKVHIKLETGMGRTGVFFADLERLALGLSEVPNIVPVGVYTHLARAAQRDGAYTQQQYERFCQGVAKLEQNGIRGLLKHVCNSAAFLDFPDWHHDFVRIGTLLTGHFPASVFSGKLQLQDPWTVRSPIVQVRRVPKGTFVGYQSLYQTKAETQLAVIPVGYADGFGIAPHLVPQGVWDFVKIVIKNFLALLGIAVGQETVSFQGRTVKVAGKIGMQLTVLDLGSHPCRVGEEVIIPLRRTLANPRLKRRYWRQGNPISERLIKEEWLNKTEVEN